MNPMTEVLNWVTINDCKLHNNLRGEHILNENGSSKQKLVFPHSGDPQCPIIMLTL